MWPLTAALPDPGSVPEKPNDFRRCVRPVWSCPHGFCFGVTKISDRNNFKEAHGFRGLHLAELPSLPKQRKCWSQEVGTTVKGLSLLTYLHTRLYLLKLPSQP